MTGLFMDVQARGGAQVQKDMQQLFIKDNPEAAGVEAEIEKVKTDPLNGFDPYIVVQGGLVSWTYPESLKPEEVVEGNTVTMRVRAIDDLDEDALKWLATEIMRLTKPSLFQTEAEAEAERKNA
jgi:hypothetical protein